MSCELKYPLCRQAGLNVTNPVNWPGACNINQDMVLAATVESLLMNAPVVYSLHHMWAPDKMDYDTKQARLLLIEPLTNPDTAESLLREFVEHWGPKDYLGSVCDRAKKLLGGGK